MIFLGRNVRTLSRVARLTVAAVAAASALAQGAGALAVDSSPQSPSSAEAGEPLIKADGMAPGDQATNRVTMRNDSTEPVALVLRTPAPAGAAHDAELCQALELAIRDEDTGRTVRAVPVTGAQPLRIARLLPGETARYRVQMRFLPRGQRPEHGADDNALQGASCPFGLTWSFAPID